MNIILSSLLVMGITGLLAAVILYFVLQKFKVEEDPRIDEVEALLPGANCGGCGSAGCRNFAERCVSSTSLDGLLCPVGGSKTMTAIGSALGMTAAEQKPKVAVLRCNGSCQARKRTNQYDGVRSCKIEHNLYIGETGCSFGCLGGGDCERACTFGAIKINPETLLPEVDDSICTACGACVKACPKKLIELRYKGPKDRRIYVSCRNEEKGAVARKACSNACIGCGKCVKECAFGAITLENNLAYIDFEKCRLCRKCAAACPTGAIHELNFPPRKEAADKPAPKAAPAPAKKEAENKTAVTEAKTVASETKAAEKAPTQQPTA